MRKTDPQAHLVHLDKTVLLAPLVIRDEMEIPVDLALPVFPAHPDLAAKI